MMDMEMKGGMVCKCPHHKIVPGLTVLFGLLFLLGNLDVLNFSFVDVAWPVLVIVAGLFKMSEGKCKCC